jgi:hypothetical protein
MKEIKKTAAKKAVKTASAKPVAKAAPKAAAPKMQPLSPEERYKQIEQAAYFIAERHGFNGDSAYFWSLAEAEINSRQS